MRFICRKVNSYSDFFSTLVLLIFIDSITFQYNLLITTYIELFFFSWI